MSSIEMNRLLTEMRLASAQAKGQVSPLEGEQSSTQFNEVLTDAVNKVNELQKDAGDLRTRFELNDPNVELPEVMIAVQKSRVAFTAVTEVRNKLIEAYKEVMGMPV